MEFEKFYIPSGNSRLDAQLKFTAEIDKMTSVYRKTLLIDRSRAEKLIQKAHASAAAAIAYLKANAHKIQVDNPYGD